MDKPLLSYTLWLQLSQGQKRKMVKLFSIPRTGESVVHVGEMMNGNIGARAQQDGHKPEDLYAITSDRMVELLNEDASGEHNFYALYDTVIKNLDDIFYENYPDEKHSTEETGTKPVQETRTVASNSEEEFVPRDPEELLKKKEEVVTNTEEHAEEKPKRTKKAKTD